MCTRLGPAHLTDESSVTWVAGPNNHILGVIEFLAQMLVFPRVLRGSNSGSRRLPHEAARVASLAENRQKQ